MWEMGVLFCALAGGVWICCLPGSISVNMQQSVALLASDIPLLKSVIEWLLKKRGKKECSHTSDGLSTHIERRDLGPGLPTTYCSIFSNELFQRN